MNFKHDVPIYTQIVNGIKLGIIRGQYRIGEKLPSVREFSLDIKVNHNTISRVFIELEREGITETKRGIGTFVVKDETLIQKLKTQFIQTACEQFIMEMKSLGLDEENMIQQLNNYMR